HRDLHSFPTRRSSDLHELISRTNRTLDDVVAVGIGLPGPVDHSTGRPITPPIMPGWNDADVPKILHRHLGGPLSLENVLVDNDVDRKSTRLNSSHVSI